jgi:hypothetical protein
MPDFSLVPVDHQPDFEEASLVPVEHDPFDADGAAQQAQAQPQQSPPQIQPAQTQPQSPSQQAVTGAGQPNAGVLTNNGQRDVAGDPNASSSPFASDIQVAANDGTPGNNQAQNAQVRAIQVELGLDDDQRRQLHKAISGQGLGFHDIRQIAIDMFGK